MAERTLTIRHFEHSHVLSSTSDRGLILARRATGLLPALVVADRQSAGRGQRSHTWWSASGGLMFSLVLPEDFRLGIAGSRVRISQIESAELSQLTAAAVARGLELTISHRFRVKPPNDVLSASGKKVAGILIESVPVGPSRRFVIGMGINVNNTSAQAPLELQERLTSLRELSQQTHSIGGVLRNVLSEFTLMLHRLG